jgi:hypothetical protein
MGVRAAISILSILSQDFTQQEAFWFGIPYMFLSMSGTLLLIQVYLTGKLRLLSAGR